MKDPDRRLRKQRRLLEQMTPGLEAGWAAYRGLVEHVPGLADELDQLPEAADYEDLERRLLSIAAREEVFHHPLFRMQWITLGDEAAVAIFSRASGRDLLSSQQFYFKVQQARQEKMGRSPSDNRVAGTEAAGHAMADILGSLRDLLAYVESLRGGESGP